MPENARLISALADLLPSAFTLSAALMQFSVMILLIDNSHDRDYKKRGKNDQRTDDLIAGKFHNFVSLQLTHKLFSLTHEAILSLHNLISLLHESKTCLHERVLYLHSTSECLHEASDNLHELVFTLHGSNKRLHERTFHLHESNKHLHEASEHLHGTSNRLHEMF